MTLEWIEIKEIVASGELQRLKRCPEETEKYHEHKRVLAEQHVSIGDYILSKLGWSEKELEEFNGDDDDTRLSRSFSNRDLFKLTVNDFPYDFAPEVFHLLIWSKISLPLYTSDEDNADVRVDTHDKIEEFIKQNLKLYLDPQTDDYSWFINYKSLQSIRGIPHVHLLIHAPERDQQSTRGQRVKTIAAKILQNNFEPAPR